MTYVLTSSTYVLTMIIKEENIFHKTRKLKTHMEKHEELAHHGVSVMIWPSAIRHSRSADQHFQSAEQHSKSAE